MNNEEKRKSTKLLSLGLLIPILYNTYIVRENNQSSPLDSIDKPSIESQGSLNKSDATYFNDGDIYTTVADIPKFYRDQIVKLGFEENTPLNEITALKLDIGNSSSALWLSECQKLRSLHLNFIENVTPSILAIYKDLPQLTDLTISTTKTENFTDATAWQTDQQKYFRKIFGNLYQSGYNSAETKYYNTRVIDLPIEPSVFSFLERCPNVTVINFIGFSYGKDTDLSWLRICQNLQTLVLKPYFENYWNLDQLKDIVNALPKLKSLQITTNSSSMTDCDLSLILYFAHHSDIGHIKYSGLMPNESFCYVKENGKNTFSPGLGDRIDYTDLIDMDIIDFSTGGLYNGLIYLNSTALNYLLSQGITIKLSPEYDMDFMTKEMVTIDKIYGRLKIAEGDSDYEKLVKVLNYITRTYKYGNTNPSINLKEKYYHEGPLYGAMNSTNIICGNYASMTCTLLERANIEAYYITNSNHAWVLAKIDGTYYYIDPTFISEDYRYHISKGYKDKIAFQKSIEGDKLFIDPCDKIIINASATKSNPYYDAQIPFWIEPFSSLYKIKEKDTKNLEL